MDRALTGDNMSSPQDTASYGVAVIDPTAAGVNPDSVRRISLSNSVVNTFVQPSPQWAELKRPLHHDIMDRLAQIDAGAARQFVARGEYLKQLKMRFVVPNAPQLTNRLNYDAVTYSWHRDSWKISDNLTPPISSSGELPKGHVRSPISHEMWKAVLAESASWQNLLWIDQVCINQDDREEKRAAVGYTDRIYQNADRVLIVIEDVSVPEEIVQAVLEVIALNIHRYTVTEFERLDKRTVQRVCNFCTTLFKARVFSRSWCWHEYASSQHHVVFMPVIGTSEDNAKILRMESHVLVQLWTIACLSRQQNVDSQMLADVQISEILFRGHRAARKLLEPHSTPSLPEAFRYVFETRATRKADQLSIVLNICGYDMVYTGDALESEDDCYRLLHSVALAAGDGSILGNDGINLRNRRGTYSTWLRNPRQKEAEPGYVMMLEKPAEMAVQIDSNGLLLLDVVPIGLVKDVQLPDPCHLDVAIAFMELDFHGIYERNPFVFERETHASVPNDWDRLEMRQRYVSQKIFYAQALSFLISNCRDSFLDEVLDPRLKRSKTALTPEHRHMFIDVLTWLRENCASGPNSNRLLQSRPQLITNQHLKITANFVEFLISSVLCVDGLQNLANPLTWDSYVVAALTCSPLGEQLVPIVVPRARLDALIVTPVAVSSAEHSLLRRIWILEATTEETNDGGQEATTSTTPTAHTPPRYSIVWKTKFHNYLDLSGSARLSVAVD